MLVKMNKAHFGLYKYTDVTQLRNTVKDKTITIQNIHSGQPIWVPSLLDGVCLAINVAFA